MKVYIGGTFDLFHTGHVALFERARRIGEVCVSLNRDEFVRRYKREPILTFDERWRMLASCRYVDQLVVNVGDEDSKPAILQVKPDFILHGDDWRGKGLMKQMMLTQEFLDEHGIKMLYLPYTRHISTTEIIKRIKER